jgi:F0F1-type ATP synthase assembly protein I
MFSSTTDIYAGLGSIATGIISDFGLFIFVIIGIVLAFYIIERLITALYPKAYGENKTNEI